MSFKNFCPTCNSSNVESFFTRENVPANQNFLIPKKNTALKIVTGNLELQICNDCSFIYNQQFHLEKVEYGNSYENSQDESPLFVEHLSKLAKNLIIKKNIRNSTIVEVGCGKGYFLKKLINFENRKNIGVGFDPSFIGNESENKNLKFIKNFYDSDSAHIQADVIVCRHVIEHIPEPVKFLKTIRMALSESKNPRIFFETPNVNWILKNHVLWDFFYEHCSYFNPKSIRTAFEIAGFKIESIEHVFNDQYMLIQASVCDDIVLTSNTNDETMKLAKNFLIQEQKHYKFWKNKIDTLFLNGKIAIWGAGAKGVTFLNLFDLNSKLIDCVIDINPKKQGMFIPGTGHKIISPNELEANNITDIIIMNPNYFEEIQFNLKQLDLKINLII
jgi:2-polyprenyl-3-methyl-5-hydroxy-6-metoxy-1,4-benzoquinol methylase